MFFRKLSTVMLVVTALALGACVTTQTSSSSSAGSEIQAKPVAKPGLSPRQRLRRALEQLEEGNEDVARVELVAYLNASPSSKTARSLLRQIDTPTEDYFPTASREITLEAGQSLSTIAKTYLGSAVEFYALAKYNDIARPKRMIPGQVVAVPLTEKAQMAFAAADFTGDGVGDSAGAKLSDAELGSALAGDVAADTATSQALELEAEPGESIGQTAIGEMDGNPVASGMEEDAVSDMSVTDADSIVEDLEGELSELGEEALIEEVAAPAVPALDVEATHRRAINAYRSQDLDTAIALWDEILAVDPDYESARLYRSQAQALKERLRRLN